MDGLSLVNKSSKTNVSPTVYLQYAYEGCKVESFESIMENLAEVMVKGFNESPVKQAEELNFSNETIVFQLINRDQNKELLADKPHRIFLDLAVVYRYVLEISDNGMATVLITNALAEKNGLSEEELFELAKENTKKIMPVLVKSMADMMLEEMGCCNPELEEALKEQNPMHVITNQQKNNGAASLMYEEYLYELASKLESDLYIIPSSVHECIALPVNVMSLDEITEMVCKTNSNAVYVEDRLSNQIYRYIRETRATTVATNCNADLVNYNIA